MPLPNCVRRRPSSATWPRAHSVHVASKVTHAQLAIIADDLSSCTDCGIQFARDGLRTYVVLDRHQDIRDLGTFDVVAVDTDSRACTPEGAYRRVAEATRFVQDTATAVYKSVDSTLRGNLGSEVDAVMDVIAFDVAAIAPAFPLYGRTTVGGTHYVHGRRIDLTEFASDPQMPVKEASLPRAFASQSRRRVGHVRLNTLRDGNAAICARLTELQQDGVELVVFDARSEDDLDVIVSGVTSSGFQVLWVGSTGLAGHLSATMSATDPTPAGGMNHERSGAPTLSVVGSASQVTRKQVAAYVRRAAASSVRMDPARIIEDQWLRDREINRCRRHVLEELRSGRDVVLEVLSSREDIAATQALGRRRDLDGAQAGVELVRSLAEICASVLEHIEVSGLVLTGGDTARAVCDRLGARGILILREVEPGIPLARIVGPHEVAIVTKAGGFGSADALFIASRLLKGGR
jgi:uncharacterized protein YgbK (DUF1537 family)